MYNHAYGNPILNIATGIDAIYIRFCIAGIIDEPNSVTTTVHQESSVTFTCKATWLRIQRFRSFCEFSSLDFESPEDLTRQLGLSLEWEIDQTGSFNSTDALTPTLMQRGITISTTCTFNAEQLFHLLELEPDNERACEQSITLGMIPRCMSIINITRQVANSNVRLQCSVQPSDDQCEDGEDVDKRTSTSVTLQLQGM